MINLGVIAVAGRGTNLLPLTKSQPKEMLPVGRKPIVQYVVEELIACHVDRLLFVTGPDKSAIENHFDVNPDLIRFLRVTGKEDVLRELAFEREDAEYFYTRQRHQNGLGQAVLCTEPFVRGHRFVVALGDTLLGLHRPSEVLTRMTGLFESQSGEVKGVIAFDEVGPREVDQYGIAAPRDIGAEYFELADLIEKPAMDQAPSRLAVAGRYVFSPILFDYLRKTPPTAAGNVELTDAVRLMIRDGHKVLGVRIPPGDRRYDIGSFESYYRAFLDFAMNDPVCGSGLREKLNG